MSKGWKFASGDWSFTCDSCGQKHKASIGKLRWDGFRVCTSCFEMRHPQDFLRARIDNQAVPWSRPKEELVFIVVPYRFYIDDGYIDTGYFLEEES